MQSHSRPAGDGRLATGAAGGGDRGAAEDPLARLRRHLRGSAGSGGGAAGPRLPLGAAAIDRALGGGLPTASLHAVAGGGGAGFVAVLAGRLAARAAGPVLWCLPAGEPAPLYPPGLPALGLDPGRLVAVLCRRPDEALQVMEDALRSGAPAAVVAEIVGEIGLTASRRLQLAAEAGATTGFLLLAAAGPVDPCPAPPADPFPAAGCDTGGAVRRAPGPRPPPGAWRTRWRVRPLPSRPPPPPAAAGSPGIRWRLALDRNRGGATGEWDVELDGTTHRFAVVCPPRQRPAVAGDRPSAARAGAAAARPAAAAG
jgi:protein ImuA